MLSNTSPGASGSHCFFVHVVCVRRARTVRTDGIGDEGGCYNRTHCMDSDVNSRTCFFVCVNLCRTLVCCFFFFFSPQAIFSHNKEISEVKSSLWSVLLLLNWSVTTVSESSRYGRSSASDMYRQYRGARREEGSLFGRLWMFHCERKKNVYSERKHGVDGILHHKNSHNIENYLQWEKKMFFFHCVKSEWMCFWHQSMPNVVHFMVFKMYFLSWLGAHVGFLSVLRGLHRELCVSSWCP